MKNRIVCFLGAMCYCLLNYAQTETSHIHVDQFGYLPNSDKVAVISDPEVGYNASESYSPGSTLQVINADTEALVFSGSPEVWNNGNVHAQSGDKGWWFDFSAVTAVGSYYVLDPTNATKSFTFDIRDDVFTEVTKAAFKMYYYNRCNDEKLADHVLPGYADGMNFMNNLQDGNARYVFDKNNSALERDLSGGWFDAGDYNKYTTFTYDPMHNLLYAFQESTAVFGDDWDLPESGNGIPDLLDEINWELAWLEKMMNADGSVIIKMGSQNYSENTSSPPSANTDQRFYGATCSSASIAVASIFAHAAKVYNTVPGLESYATTLEAKAINCFDYALPKLTTNQLDESCDNGEIVAGDADVNAARQREWAIEAAVYLYELTNNSVYGDYIKNNITDVSFVNNNWLGQGTNTVLEALLHYSTFANADAATVAEIDQSIRQHVEEDWNNFFGMNTMDLYRAQMPDWGYDWGSSKSKADFALLNRVLRLYDFYPTDSVSYVKKEMETVHYFHGINPLNVVYLSNMYSLGAEHSINQLYHTWFYEGTDYDDALTSLYGPAPGFVTGGPNAAYPYTGLTPPYGQPQQKSYLDFNDGGPPIDPWRISEPAIYYQASYLRLVAAFASESSMTKDVQVETAYIEMFPNPTNGVFVIEGLTDLYDIEIIDSNATVYQTLTGTGRITIDISSLPSGIYLVRITNKNDASIMVQQMIKMN